jgi:hypothetical protein
MALIFFIVALARMVYFCRLTLASLPGATQGDLQRMRRASIIAFLIMMFFSGPSLLAVFFPSLGLPQDNDVRFLPVASAIVGLIIAAIFDFKAERIKRRYQRKSDEFPPPVPGQLRWYHIVVAILLPYVGLPWGIVNLIKKRRRSGLVMTLVSAIVLILLGIQLLVVNSGAPRQGWFRQPLYNGLHLIYIGLRDRASAPVLKVAAKVGMKFIFENGKNGWEEVIRDRS